MTSSAAGRQNAVASQRQSTGGVEGFGQPAPRWVELNLAQGRFGERTRSLVRQAKPQGTLEWQADGNPVLRTHSRLLGAPQSSSELRRIVAEGGGGAAYIVFGVGVGHTPSALRALGHPPVAIFEPDPALLRTFLEIGPSELGAIDVLCDFAELAGIWERVTRGRSKINLLTSVGYAEQYPEELARLQRTLNELGEQSRIHRATQELRSRAWVEDVVENAALLADHPTFLGLADAYTGVPAFIVGAGPSLEKNLAELARAKERGIVFAVNTSGRALAAAGLSPHVLACMESIDVSHQLEGLPFLDSVVRAFSLSAHPKTLRTGRGPLLPVFEALPMVGTALEKLVGARGLAASGSVSTLAFALALRLGCSPVVLVGQDLAYTDGHAYAAGTSYEASRASVSEDGQELVLHWADEVRRTHDAVGKPMHEREPLRRVDGWGGGSVCTGPSFLAVREWFEGAARVVAREAPHRRLVNASEGGARIEGFEECRLAELLDELPLLDVDPLAIARAAHAVAPPLGAAALVNWALEETTLLEDVRRTARRARRRATLALARLDAGDTRRLSRALEALARDERELQIAQARVPLVEGWALARLGAASRAAARGTKPNEQARAALSDKAQAAEIVEAAAAEVADRLRHAYTNQSRIGTRRNFSQG